MICLDQDSWAVIRKLPAPSGQELQGLEAFIDRHAITVRQSPVLNDLIFVMPGTLAYTTLSTPIECVEKAVATLSEGLGL